MRGFDASLSGRVLAVGIDCLALLSAWACVSGIAVSDSQAADARWLGGTGVWNDPTQWSTNPNYPSGGGYNVEIGSGTVDLNTTVGVSNLTLTGGTLTRSAGAFTLTTGGLFRWSGGTLTSVPMNLRGGMAIEGQVVLGGGQTLDLPKGVGTVDNIATQRGGDLLFGPGGGTIQTHTGTSPNDPDSRYSLLDDSGMFSNGGTGTLINFGILEKIGGTGVSTIDATLLRSDTVNVSSGTLLFAGDVSEFFTGTTIDGGRWNVLNGSTLAFSRFNASAGSVITINHARIVLSGPTAKIADANGDDIFSSYLTRNDSYLTIANGASFAPPTFTNNSNLTIESGASFTAPAGFRNNRNFTIQNGVDFTAPTGFTSGSGATLTIGADSTFSVGGAADYVATGTTILAADTSTIQVDAGHTVSNPGTLRGIGTVRGNLINSGVIQMGLPDEPGVLSVEGNFTEGSGATLSIQLPTPGTIPLPQLSVLGWAEIDGMLEVSLLEGFTASLEDEFVILTSTGGVSGRFTNSVIQEMAFEFEIVYEPNRVVLQPTIVPEPGTLLLLGSGLLVIAFARRTEKGSRLRSSTSVLSLSVFTLAGTVQAEPMFTGLGDLAGGAVSSEAWAVSADGSTVVGESVSASGMEAFRWTSATGMVGLGDLPGGSSESSAYGVSGDGSTIVGRSTSTLSGFQYEAFLWTSETGMVGLGDLPGGGFDSRANAVTPDGSIIVGGGLGAGGGEPFLWTSAAGMIGLGQLPGGNVGGSAWAVSADGATVVGYSQSEGQGDAGPEAFRWTSATGIVGLGDFSGGQWHSAALGVSADGSVVVGSGTRAIPNYPYERQEAFVWTSEGGMVGLGTLPGTSSSIAEAISADGSTVVGRSSGAFIWDEVNGMRSIQALLVSGGVDLTGWELDSAYGISADGRTIVGSGRNPNGETEGWLAIIPEPSTGALLLLGLVGIGAAPKRLLSLSRHQEFTRCLFRGGADATRG